MISKKLSTDNLDIIFFDLNKKWESYNKKKMLESIENTGINFILILNYPKSMIFKSWSKLNWCVSTLVPKSFSTKKIMTILFAKN